MFIPIFSDKNIIFIGKQSQNKYVKSKKKKPEESCKEILHLEYCHKNYETKHISYIYLLTYMYIHLFALVVDMDMKINKRKN